MSKKLYIEFIFLVLLGALTSLSLPPFNYFVINFFTFSLFFYYLIKKSYNLKNKKLLFVYGWLFFKGGLSEFIFEGMALIFSQLPHPFANWNGLALAWGVAFLIGYRALNGSSWLAAFDDSRIKQKLFPDAPSKRALLYGIISYFGFVNGTILLFWLAVK